MSFLFIKVIIHNNWNMSQEKSLSIRQRLAKNIIEYRDKAKLKREALSLALSMDNSYISKVEKCRVNVPIDRIEMIANYFGVDVLDLLK